MKAEMMDFKNKKNLRIIDEKRRNKKYILGIIWQMMRAHSLEVIGNKKE